MPVLTASPGRVGKVYEGRTTGGVIVGVSKVFMARTWLFFGAALFALVASMLSARAVFAQPPNVGEEPAAGPIVYNLIPSEGAVVPQNQLSRAGATIETQRDAGLAWTTVFVDGRRRPSTLMGPTSYYQSVSADIGNLGPGIHTVWVVAIDGEGRAGGYAWTFAVV